MGLVTLTYSMETDRLAGIKANSVHVDANFDTLVNAVNTKLENDGSILPIADLSMNNHKLTTVATPTLSGDAATKGYVDQNALMLAGAQTVTGNKSFSGNLTAVTQTNTDNSTKVATTAFVRSVFETIYPVGSMYIGTGLSCPLATLFGTWEEVASNVVISINNTAAVVGNGMTLGLTNGDANGGLIQLGSPYRAAFKSTAYGEPIQQTNPNENNLSSRGYYGLTTDAPKSGVVANITSSSLSVKIWKRTA